MRPFTQLMSFADARRVVLDAAVPIERTEVLPIAEADGRVAAGDVSSPVDVPPFDRAAMDGYAVLAIDTATAGRDTPCDLRCVGRVFTSEAVDRRIGPGECIEVATGAPMPAGATAVVMVEHTDRHDDAVRVFAAVNAGQHIGRQGADIGTGRTVVASGDVLSPSRVGALAGIGLTTVRVYARPSVAICSTGNEVIPPGQALGVGQIYDINRFTTGAVVARHGGMPTVLTITADTMRDLDAALTAAEEHDIAVFSGGSSVGTRDLMKDALAARGEVLFHGIAVKPGKPTLFGRIGGTLVFGMPGYPTSCLSNAYMLLVPLLHTTARLPPWQPRTRTLPLARRIASAPGRHQFYTVRIADGQAEPAFKASGDITSMANADGFIEIPASADAVDAGTMVTVTLF